MWRAETFVEGTSNQIRRWDSIAKDLAFLNYQRQSATIGRLKVEIAHKQLKSIGPSASLKALRRTVCDTRQAPGLRDQDKALVKVKGRCCKDWGSNGGF